jgi:hypothetical protein
VECASSGGIPIVCVVDCDKQTLRSIVDGYMEGGDSFLFDEQVIAVTSQGREHSYSLIIEAIQRAVQAAFTSKQTTLTPPTADSINDADDDRQTELMVVLRAKFGTAKAAFDSFSNEGTIGKKEWRHIVKKMLPAMPALDSKALRKKLPKKVNLMQFRDLLDEVEPSDKQALRSESTSHSSSRLAELPSDVPVLPTSFQSRPYAQEQLVAALLDSGGNSSTAVTAPKSRVSSQGMGGVGKTMLTAAVVRDERVRAAFDAIGWLNMSQAPALMNLQEHLYAQLTDNKKLEDKNETIDGHLSELTKICLQRKLLLVLDDMVWHVLCLIFLHYNI